MGYVILHQIDAEKGQARYYGLTWVPALITGRGWAVERAWGRLGSSRRQQKTTVVEDREAAMAAVIRHLRRRLQHSYLVSESDEDGHALLELVETRHGEDHETTN